MGRARVTCGVVLMALAAAWPAAQQPPAQGQSREQSAPPVPQQSPAAPAAVFRSVSSAVSVDVSVRRGNRPVMKLTAADFQITDNGVPQRVERVDFETVPIDLTLIVDLSGSTATFVDRIRRDAREILSLLRPIDRVRVLAIHTAVRELVPLQPVTGRIAVDTTIPTFGRSSIRDALAAALISRVELDRRRLVIAITDGEDTKSIVEADTLLDIARRSDTVLHLVLVEPPAFGTYFFAPGGTDAPTGAFNRQMTIDEWNTMLDAAVATGGAFHGGRRNRIGGSRRDAVDAFKDVFAQFRQSYVVHYQPEGVAATGWHELAVSVTGVDARGISARKGYFGGRGQP